MAKGQKKAGKKKNQKPTAKPVAKKPGSGSKGSFKSAVKKMAKGQKKAGKKKKNQKKAGKKKQSKKQKQKQKQQQKKKLDKKRKEAKAYEDKVEEKIQKDKNPQKKKKRTAERAKMKTDDAVNDRQDKQKAETKRKEDNARGKKKHASKLSDYGTHSLEKSLLKGYDREVKEKKQAKQNEMHPRREQQMTKSFAEALASGLSPPSKEETKEEAAKRAANKEMKEAAKREMKEMEKKETAEHIKHLVEGGRPKTDAKRGLGQVSGGKASLDAALTKMGQKAKFDAAERKHVKSKLTKQKKVVNEETDSARGDLEKALFKLADKNAAEKKQTQRNEMHPRRERQMTKDFSGALASAMDATHTVTGP